MDVEAVVILSDVDPVAKAVGEEWGTPPAFGGHIEGAAIRRLNDRILVVRRPGPHIHDEGVDRLLPPELRRTRPTLVFPSIHRSERNVPSLTVHPLGNPGPAAEVGGRPRTLVPTDPRRMALTLRLLDEGSPSVGFEATYEATHHGPAVDSPAFFVEIGYGELSQPPPIAVRLLSTAIPRIAAEPGDRVALAVGGGHYAPHFTDLALRRRWAFGHILSRHHLSGLDRATAKEAYTLTEGSEGVVFARAQDALHPVLEHIGPRLRDQGAPLRGPGGADAIRHGARSASGT